ncbi:hypothetical protein GCM10010840_27250 [Deinococcus aerolatus]|uniref:Uncharacterized protein n=1 Tax=Deinococcus aerolatus TaxID=522487 RepID=A0ABQ2GDJ9_9DEIO|nr:hypothetical protein GCM10010840_27250 [Deinococcus aerolatus]
MNQKSGGGFWEWPIRAGVRIARKDDRPVLTIHYETSKFGLPEQQEAFVSFTGSASAPHSALKAKHGPTGGPKSDHPAIGEVVASCWSPRCGEGSEKQMA